MGASWLATAVASPLGIAVMIAAVLLSSIALYSGGAMAPMRPKRLAFGYAGLTAACIAIAGVSSYVPQEGALAKWKVPPENYWPAIAENFATNATLLVFFSLVGAAVIGVPLVFAMAKRGLGTVPWILLASVVLSALLSILLSSGDPIAFQHLIRTFLWLSGTHAALTLSFGIAAGLPWRNSPRTTSRAG